MTPLDWMLTSIRWGHALAAVAWVGGSLFYALALRPALSRAPAPAETQRAIGLEFQSVVGIAIAMLLITGVVLSVSRLTAQSVSAWYVAALALKVALAVYMFFVARLLRRGPETSAGEAPAGWRARLGSPTALLAAGVLVIGLSDVLSMLFEAELRR